MDRSVDSPRRDAGTLRRVVSNAALLAALSLAGMALGGCGSGSGSDSGTSQFSGQFQGIVTEDGVAVAVGAVAISGVGPNGRPVTISDRPETASDRGYGVYRVLDGQWTYTLDSTGSAVQSLDAGESMEDTFSVVASDRSSRRVTITIRGAEDAPFVTGDDTGVVVNGRWTTTAGSLHIVDVDTNDSPAGFDDVAPVPGRAGLGSFELSDGRWTYRLDTANPDLGSLGTGEFLSDSHVFEASDGVRVEVVVSVYSATSPNFLVVLADDLGYADVGFNGSQEIPTPNIDSIAANGIHFPHGTASHPFCSPTRAGLVTGRSQHRFGHVYNPVYAPDDPAAGLPLGEVLISDVLAGADYVTGLIGKWHLGAAPHFHPNARGFREFFGFLGGGHDYLASADNDELEKTAPLLRNRTPLATHPGYLTDVFSREAVSFIERNAVAPFFLFLSYSAPHTPLQAPWEYQQRFSHIEDQKRRTYAAMVSALDDGVGDVLAALRDRKLLGSTLIIFLGDNGGDAREGADNGLRGDKAGLYEGGIRVPFAMQWAGTLPAGVTYPHQVSSLDVFPTIAAAAGVTVPADRVYDGVNLLPFIEDAAGGDVPHDRLMWRSGAPECARSAVREERFKLLFLDDGRSVLYDLVDDPLEATDIADARPDVVRRLQDAFLLWNSEMTAPPAFPPAYGGCPAS